MRKGVSAVGWTVCGDMVSVLSGFMARPCRSRWSAVLWHLMLCFAARQTRLWRGCLLGRDVSLRVELKSKCCISNGIGSRLVWASMESVGDVLITPVMASAATLWICVIGTKVEDNEMNLGRCKHWIETKEISAHPFKIDICIGRLSPIGLW